MTPTYRDDDLLPEPSPHAGAAERTSHDLVLGRRVIRLGLPEASTEKSWASRAVR